MGSNKQTLKFLGAGIATALAACAAVAPQAAFAAPVYSADTLISSASLQNSGKDELAFFRNYAGNQSLTPTKPEGKVVAANDNGQWYIDLGTSAPGYFLLKFGGGSTGQHSHYLFKNDGANGANKLVWTNEQVNFLTGGANCLGAAVNAESSCNIGRLSHYSFAGATMEQPVNVPPAEVPTTNVPEPGSLALAGLGLLALCAVRKKRVGK